MGAKDNFGSSKQVASRKRKNISRILYLIIDDGWMERIEATKMIRRIVRLNVEAVQYFI
jgi:hypothetical protein